MSICEGYALELPWRMELMHGSTGSRCNRQELPGCSSLRQRQSSLARKIHKEPLSSVSSWPSLWFMGRRNEFSFRSLWFSASKSLIFLLISKLRYLASKKKLYSYDLPTQRTCVTSPLGDQILGHGHASAYQCCHPKTCHPGSIPVLEHCEACWQPQSCRITNTHMFIWLTWSASVCIVNVILWSIIINGTLSHKAVRVRHINCVDPWQNVKGY